MNNNLAMLIDVAKKLNAMNIISINQVNVHCRERFFIDNCEPERFEINGKYLTVTQRIDGVDFIALFDVPKAYDPELLYREVVEQLKAKAAA